MANKSKDYLPKDEPGIADWFDNYGAKMDTDGANYGFSSVEVKQAKDDAVMVRNIVTAMAAVEAFRREYVQFKRIMLYGAKNIAAPVYPTMTLPVEPALLLGMLGGIIKRMRSYVKRLKEASNYNDAVGADWRVLPIQEEGIGELEAKPTLKPTPMADSEVDINFVRGEWDGVEVEMQRGSDVNDWTSLGRFYKSPAEDDTPPVTPNTPETRRYRGRFLKGNKPVGQHSDIVSIVTIP